MKLTEQTNDDHNDSADSINSSKYFATEHVLQFGRDNTSISILSPPISNGTSMQATLSFPDSPPPRVIIEPATTNITAFGETRS